jgi:S1-C subfamily serine protease
MVQPGAIGRFGRLDLDSRWHGGDEGVVHLPHLNGLRMVRIIGTTISADALIKELPKCETLQTVWLYGTKLTPDDVAKLRKVLPEQVEIDYRKGALLGVSSATPDGSGPPIVRAVTAGSAAAAAGIQAGDVIQKFNGEQLASFKMLTQRIANYQPGDEVELTIARGGQEIPVKVKLGQWKNLEE